ncbi:MAG: hypothetical protein ACJAR2_002253 [Ilumatobacter sp.]|jgi:hypothetical protein
MRAESPMMLAAIDVIGATVVTTVNLPDVSLDPAPDPSVVESSELPHDETSNAAITEMAIEVFMLKIVDASWTHLHVELVIAR